MTRHFKSVTILLLFLISSVSLFGQKGARISYFNKKGMLASDEDALYYRTSTDTVNFYRSYYIHSKTRFFAGYIKSASDSTDHTNTYYDTCRWYYPNGRVQKEYVYNTQGQLNGICKDYSVDGHLNKEIEYTLNQRGNYYTEYSWAGERMAVFEENFTANHNQWPAGTNDTGHCKLKLGGIELMNTTSRFFLRRAPVEPTGNHYSIEVSVNSNYLSDSLRAGIVFNYKDNRNYSYFFVSKFRLYIGKISEGVEQKIANNFYSFLLKPTDWNKLQVITTGDTLIFGVNDELATFITHKNAPQNLQTGLGILNQGTTVFDNFVVKTFDQKIQLSHLFCKKKYEKMTTDEYGISGTSMGLVLSDNGLILARYTPVRYANEIFVQAYDSNDSLIKLSAKVKYNNAVSDMALLEIVNPENKKLFAPAYTFFNKPEIPKKIQIKAWYLKKTGFQQFKSDSLLASLEANTLGGYAINPYENTFRILTDPMSRISLSGATFFTPDGEFIGMLTDGIQKNNKLQNISFINTLIFQSGEKIQKNKTANTGSIYKNVVHIRTR